MDVMICRKETAKGIIRTLFLWNYATGYGVQVIVILITKVGDSPI